ncbi:hypothetical protein Sango_1328800 [Sesamum angolense]|uniref:Senescence regulator n=1 Tax=Sesamum angolense TaxID=2727404 RepID=A0AAE1WSQ1_9LAMI|nr:hypothetical protein Sango_1328800 [Sesamum angolense]
MENRYGLYSQGSSGWTSLRNEEFHEEDVWGVFKGRKDTDSRAMIITSSSFVSKRLPTAARMIPKSSSNKNDPAAASQEPKVIQHSAPVNIPDWSKIYGTISRNNTSSSWLDSDSGGDGNGNGNGRSSWESEEDDDDDDEDNDGDVIPPHEWIARKQGRSQISSFSVCEGAGRTLKGRDLSRVRNAVLRKTGFLESKPDY